MASIAATSPRSCAMPAQGVASFRLFPVRYGPAEALCARSAASLVANVAVAQPTAAGRVIAAWPSFALISAPMSLLMRQVRHGAAGSGKSPQQARPRQLLTRQTGGSAAPCCLVKKQVRQESWPHRYA